MLKRIKFYIIIWTYESIVQLSLTHIDKQTNLLFLKKLFTFL